MQDSRRTGSILPPPVGKSIQQTSETPSVPARGPGLKESLRKHNQSSGRKVSGQLGRAIYCNTIR